MGMGSQGEFIIAAFIIRGYQNWAGARAGLGQQVCGMSLLQDSAPTSYGIKAVLLWAFESLVSIKRCTFDQM